MGLFKMMLMAAVVVIIGSITYSMINVVDNVPNISPNKMEIFK